MRITSFHVDGFGALASLGEEDLAPGLVVVHGPNEAGKSTLFDFLTGVLFGFPQRRDNAHFHAPVRGGRHGGRVGFTDDSGGEWVVERHAGPQRGLRVQLPDGSPGDERDLARVLAGASPALFRAVFAIGVDDLRQLDTLTTDEVRELLFASSIFGQRRSATKAIKQLGDARDDLARPRREDARANRLARAIVETRAELSTARREMSTFADLSHRASAADSRVLELRQRAGAERVRERELELLMTCWKSHSRAESSRNALSTLAMAAPGSDEERSEGALLHLEPELRDLAAELSGHKERLSKLDELDYQHERLAASIQRRVAQLGAGWTAERVRQLAQPHLLAERARTARQELAELSGAEATAGALLVDAEEALRELVSEGDITCATASEALGLAPGDVSELIDRPSGVSRRREEIDSSRRAVFELRERMAELDEAKAVILNAGAGQTYTKRKGPARAGQGTALFALVLGAVIFGAVAVSGVADHQPAIAAVAGVVAILLAAAGAYLTGRLGPGGQSRPLEAGPTAFQDPKAVSEATEIGGRARHEIACLAGQLALGVPPSKVDVERLDAALQDKSAVAGRLEDHLLARRKSEARVAGARRAFDAAGSRLADAEAAFSQWQQGCGLGSGSPDSVLDSLASVIELKEDLEGLRRIAAAIAGLEGPVARVSARLERLVFVGPEADGPADDLWTDERLEERLRVLLELASAARQRLQGCLALEDEIARSEREIDEALGSGDGADRLRRELATGQVLNWRKQLDELETAREALRHAEEEAVRQHQSATEAMAQLATSDRIITLEQRLAALEDELEHVIDQYLVLGTARALLRRTLSLHERERQPAVIARAASHFDRVTAGRYVGLVPNAGADGHQSIRAVNAHGSTIDATDLSRGTIEQLYLCLRLGLADSFADRAVSLPVFLDDVLVNFDPARAQAVATELAASAAGHQIIFFTCHPHLAELALKASSEGPVRSQLLELSRL